MKKIKLVILVLTVFSLSLSLYGCANKPDLKHWSKATAYYLLSKKFPKYKVELIKCKSGKVFGSNIAICRYYLITKYKYKYSSEFVQSVNNNWYIDSSENDTITIIKPIPSK